MRSSADYANLFFQIITGLFLYDGAYFFAQRQHVCAGGTAKVHHKAAVLLADGGTAVSIAPQTALVNEGSGKSPHRALEGAACAGLIQRLLIQAKEDGCFELLLLELSTGLRRGEICALQWDDLNFNTGELQVKRQVHRVKGELAVSEPKTKASNRSVILPPPVLMVLSDYKTEINSVWLFPSPLNNDSPRDPAAVRKRLTTILERADCKRVRFHDLRHTFATASLEHGMDIKTLSTIIGHVSTATTLNVYAHVTDEMRKIAAAKIDRGIAKSESLQDIDTAPRKPAPSTFLPHKGQRRKPGTGCVSQINEKLWEGRYSPKLPNGDRLARNVYAHSEKECEQKLAELIVQMKAEIAAQRQQPQAPA